jgi:hypothetical protein
MGPMVRPAALRATAGRFDRPAIAGLRSAMPRRLGAGDPSTLEAHLPVETGPSPAGLRAGIPEVRPA